ncbi:MAG: Kazal-type serine protease inhibitor family protein [Bacteroidota bacterium]
MKTVKATLILLTLVAVIFQSCNDDESPDGCFCTEQFEPVCGDDGETYANSCFAECAGVGYTAGTCTIQAVGLVKDLGAVPADGCGFVIEVNDVDLKPLELAAEFQEDSLEVNIDYRLMSTAFTCGVSSKAFFEITVEEISKR